MRSYETIRTLPNIIVSMCVCSYVRNENGAKLSNKHHVGSVDAAGCSTAHARLPRLQSSADSVHREEPRLLDRRNCRRSGQSGSQGHVPPRRELPAEPSGVEKSNGNQRHAVQRYGDGLRWNSWRVHQIGHRVGWQLEANGFPCLHHERSVRIYFTTPRTCS